MKHSGWMFCACMAVCVLSACGEFAYKRGGQAGELAEVQSDCHKSAGTGAPYEQCMASHGWTVQNLELEPLVASTSVNPDNRASPQADAAAALVPAPAAASSPAASAVSSSPVSVATETASAPQVPSTTTGSKTAAATPVALPAVPPVTPQSAPDDPLQLLKINSMWKFGGTASQLQDAIDACVATLGETHRPVTGKQQLMTRALVSCLRSKGWYGVSNR